MFTAPLLRWFETSGRRFPWRRKVSAYRLLVAEKLLQKTTARQVNRIYSNFFKKYPTVETLSRANMHTLKKDLSPLGLQKQRAAALKKMALDIVTKHGGQVPKNESELLQLPGVGAYVTNALLCFRFGHPKVVVDVNVKRICRRFFGENLDDDEIKKKLSKLLPGRDYKRFNWALLDLGAVICIARAPLCHVCPLTRNCRYFMNFWIEVTSGMRWIRLVKEGGVALEAPDTTRYRNFFKNLKTGGFVLHYLTASLTRQKEKRSSVMGVSRIASDPTVVDKKIVARCSGTIEFPKPVPYSELHRIGRKSREFDTLLRMGMQRYLTQISRSDFDSILGAYPANRKQFSKLALSTS